MVSASGRLQRRLLGLPLALCIAAASGHESVSLETANVVNAPYLATLNDIGGLSVSPDGVWAAFQVRRADPGANRYDTAWHVVATQGIDARRLAAAGEPIQPPDKGRVNGFILASPAAWSPDSVWIAYLRRDGGRTQIWRSSLDGRRTEQLTRSESDVRALAYSRDGLRLLFETEPSAAQVEAALAREGRTGFLYDRRFFPSYGPTPVMPADASFGDEVGSYSESQVNARRIWVFDIARRRDRRATEAEQLEFAALTATARPSQRPAFRGIATASPAGELAWTEARDPERQGGLAPLTIVAQATGANAPIVCTVAECTSQRVKGLWWRNEDELVFARGEGPLFQGTALYAWRPGQRDPRLIVRTPDKLTSSSEWDCAVAKDRLICFYEQPSRPRRLVAIDLDTGAIETLHDPNPGFARFDLGPAPRRLEFEASSDVDTYGYLVLPPRYRSGERLPLVVVTYRCSGFLRGGTGDEYPVYPFAAQGFAVLCFNTPDTDYERLARMDWTAYAKWMRGPGDPEKHRVQEALDSAIDRLDTMGIIDRDRVGLTGLSFGAETVSFALLTNSKPRLAAAIASGTGIEPMDYYLYGPSGRGLLRSWGLGAPDATAERWRGFALSPNAARARAPLLLNVADHEVLSALQPVTALEDAGRAVEMYVFPDEYHIKWQPAHRLAIYNRNIDWMNFWLRGVEDPAPAKAEQYRRWRAMRENQCRLFGPNGAEPVTATEIPWYCRPGALDSRP